MQKEEVKKIEVTSENELRDIQFVIYINII
jgi:hypothetical protein